MSLPSRVTGGPIRLKDDYVGRRSLSSLTLPSSLPSSQARVPLSEEPPLLRPKERHVQSLSYWKVGCAESVWSLKIPLAPLMDKEIFGTGVSIKEEISGDVTEEMWLEVKEEPYADEANDEVFSLSVGIRRSGFTYANVNKEKEPSERVIYCSVNIKRRLRGRSRSSLTLPSPLLSSEARVPLSEEPPMLRPTERHMQSQSC
ncbi:hypothetical protein C7M84_009159 [Penaeus vannamei]|uniref:Uncharacterized protein n=1 Tax=Penaeus vannamei TaxID=6689 RepID=A0A423T7M5_PENVA|nr:hypothetical protein C7M84_009159 [Penaeus vannamei]